MKNSLLKNILMAVTAYAAISLQTNLAIGQKADKARPKSIQDAWQKIAGKGAQSSNAFALPTHRAELPNVFIYGDSISIGYTPQVRKELEGVANVYRLHANGGDSSSVIDKMKILESTMRAPELDGHWTFQWDVIHFNVGLHDLKYLDGKTLDKKNGKQVLSTEVYAENLRKIIAYWKEIAPRATLIFATTTPVPEGEAGRHVEDAIKYNQVALKVMSEYPEILVDDLYKLTLPKQPEWWKAPGNVHFNPIGIEAQGREVARVIRDALKSRPVR